MKKMSPTKSSPQYLIIIGNIASGKSTATRILSEKLTLPVIEADTLFQTTNPYREDFLADMPRWALGNELWMTVNRVELLSQYTPFDPNQLIIVDSGLLMSWVYTFSHHHNGVMNTRDWQLYQQLFSTLADGFLSNIRVLYLQYSVPVLMERISKRGRQFELDFYTPAYVSCLEQGLTALVTILKKKKVPLIELGQQQVKDFENVAADQKKLIKGVRPLLR